jgi:ferric enterobactin receptor
MSGIRLIITSFFCIMLSAASAQVEVVINEEFDDRRVNEVLQFLGEKYNLSFAYDGFQLSKIEGSWRMNGISIENALLILFENTGFTFKYLDETFIIYPDVKQKEFAVDEGKTISGSRLSGEVRDVYTRELLPFTVLSIRNSFYVVNADAEGRFLIDETFTDNDTLEVFFVGYEVKEFMWKDVQNKSDIKIYLTPLRNYLPDVLITAEGSKLFKTGFIPGLSAISPNSLGVIHGTGEADVMRAAQLLPGINATQESSNGLYIRGSNNDQTQISFDGFNLYHQDHFFGAFAAINANALKVLNIRKGITDGRFGGRAAGVVEIVGKEGNLIKPSGQIDVGPFSIGAVFESPTDSLGKSSVFIAARRAFTNVVFSPTYKGLFNTTYNAAVVTAPDKDAQTFGSNNPEFFFQDFNFKFSYRPTTNDFINLSVYTSRDQLFVQYADSSDKELENPYNIHYTDESYKKNVGTAVRWGRSWSNNWNSLLVAGFSRFTGNFFSSDSIQNLLFQTDSVRFTSELTQLDDFDGRFELNKQFKGHRLSSGLQLNSISSGLKRNEVGSIIQDAIANGMIISGYVCEENESNDRLKIKPSLRVNYFNRTSSFYFEPRMILQFELIKKRLDLKASAGRVHQYIQRTQTQSLYLNTPDYWWIAQASGKGVLVSDQVMFGFVYAKKNWTFDVESYFKITEGNILNSTILGLAGSQSADNFFVGQGRAIGADVLLSKDVKRHHFVLSYSMMKTEVDFLKEQLINIPEVFDQRHELKFNYQLNLKKWDFSVFWVFGSGRPYTPVLGTYNLSLPDGEFRKLPVYGRPNSARLPEYHRLDITGSYHFVAGSTGITIQASVFNAYNRINLRDIQYLIVRESNDPNDYSIAQRSLRMLGFLPSLNLKLSF